MLEGVFGGIEPDVRAGCRRAYQCRFVPTIPQRKCDAYWEAQQARRWAKDVENFRNIDNSELHVGVMGLGEAGRQAGLPVLQLLASLASVPAEPPVAGIMSGTVADTVLLKPGHPTCWPGSRHSSAALSHSRRRHGRHCGRHAAQAGLPGVGLDPQPQAGGRSTDHTWHAGLSTHGCMDHGAESVGRVRVSTWLKAWVSLDPQHQAGGWVHAVLPRRLFSAFYRSFTSSAGPTCRHLPQKSGVRCYHGTEQLQEFASKVDVLVCLLPLTDATRQVAAVLHDSCAASPCTLASNADLCACLLPLANAASWLSVNDCAMIVEGRVCYAGGVLHCNKLDLSHAGSRAGASGTRSCSAGCPCSSCEPCLGAHSPRTHPEPSPQPAGAS